MFKKCSICELGCHLLPANDYGCYGTLRDGPPENLAETMHLAPESCFRFWI